MGKKYYAEHDPRVESSVPSVGFSAIRTSTYTFDTVEKAITTDEGSTLWYRNINIVATPYDDGAVFGGIELLQDVAVLRVAADGYMKETGDSTELVVVLKKWSPTGTNVNIMDKLEWDSGQAFAVTTSATNEGTLRVEDTLINLVAGTVIAFVGKVGLPSPQTVVTLESATVLESPINAVNMLLLGTSDADRDIVWGGDIDADTLQGFTPADFGQRVVANIWTGANDFQQQPTYASDVLATENYVDTKTAATSGAWSWHDDTITAPPTGYISVNHILLDSVTIIRVNKTTANGDTLSGVNLDVGDNVFLVSQDRSQSAVYTVVSAATDLGVYFEVVVTYDSGSAGNPLPDDLFWAAWVPQAALPHNHDADYLAIAGTAVDSDALGGLAASEHYSTSNPPPAPEATVLSDGTDLDNVTATGMYTWDSATGTTGWTSFNFPTASAATMQVINNPAVGVSQTIIDELNTMFYRGDVIGATVSKWQELTHADAPNQI